MRWLRAIFERRRPDPRSVREARLDVDAIGVFEVPAALERFLRYTNRCPQRARALASAMRRVRPRDWTRLASNSHRMSLTKDDVADLAKLDTDDAVELVGVATLSASGYTREWALVHLARLAHPRGVPFTLLRFGDWVGPVRGQAVSTLDALLEAGAWDAVIAHYRQVDHLLRVRRVDLRPQHERLIAKLRTDAARPAVEAALGGADAPVRRFCWRLRALDLGRDRSVVHEAAADRDAFIRAWAAHAVASGDAPAPQTLWRTLLRDPSPRVAAAMIRAMNLDQAREHAEVIEDLAVSDHTPLRRSAQFVLDRLGGIDVGARCRRLIDEAPPATVRAGWLSALGEQGDESDVTRVRPFLVGPTARRRAAALGALGRLDGPPAIDDILRGLRDPSGRVRRVAQQMIATLPPSSWLTELRGAIASGPRETRRAALETIASRGGWDALPGILEGACCGEAEIESLAERKLAFWNRWHRHHGWIRPSPRCLDELRDVWPRARSQCDDAIASGPIWRDVRAVVEQTIQRGS